MLLENHYIKIGSISFPPKRPVFYTLRDIVLFFKLKTRFDILFFQNSRVVKPAFFGPFSKKVEKPISEVFIPKKILNRDHIGMVQ